MSLLQTLHVSGMLDNTYIRGEDFVNLFAKYPQVIASNHRVVGSKGSTDFVRIVISGTQGKLNGGSAPTLGIIGGLGGVGARPKHIGMVSEADGAITALSCALKLAEMQIKGDELGGDVIITTHICPDAPTLPHEPVDFMDSPITIEVMNEHEVDQTVDAVLSIDTTKGNSILNNKGYAISPTVKQGYILPISESLLRIMEMTSGRPPMTFPITTQDITPYGNGVYHLNSILQPSVATDAPVVGVAICTESEVSGYSMNVSHEEDISMVVKFAVEVAKEFGRGECAFYDNNEFALLRSLYGSMSHLQMRK